MIRRLILATGLAAFALTGCHRQAASPRVERAWVRLPAVAGQPAAAYFTIVGGNDGGDRLIRMESALAAQVEMHRSMAGMGGMTTMKPLDHIDVPANAPIIFAPGGPHAMLIGLDKAVTPGTAVPLRFGFASGKTAEAEAKTVAAGADAPY